MSLKIDESLTQEHGDVVRVRTNPDRSPDVLLSLEHSAGDYAWTYLTPEQAQTLAGILTRAANHIQSNTPAPENP